MSAERPVRISEAPPPEAAGTSTRPDAGPSSVEEPDSLMSRLDGSGEPAAAARPNAAELLGGRGRRRRTIRVPDDAVPAATPPPAAVRKSTPPFLMNAANEGLLPPPMPPLEAPPVSQPVPIAGAIMPSRIVSIGVEPAAVSVRSSLHDLAPAAPIAPVVEAQPIEHHVAPIAEPLAPSDRPPTPPSGNVVLVEMPTPLGLGDHPVAPLAPPIAEMTLPAASAPSGDGLHATVREALALLDRESEPPDLDIKVEEKPDVEEEEPELEEVSPAPKKIAAPAPPPRRAGVSDPVAKAVSGSFPPAAGTMPAAQSSPGAERPISQPPLVAAAAATVSNVATGAPVAPAPVHATAAANVTANIAPQPSAESGGEPKKRKKLWFEELFNDDYARTLPRLSPSFLDREVTFIDESLGCEKGATILDLGCGPGEQAVRLAKRGYEVIGVDLSLAMLARAADEAADHGQRINFVQGDMRELAFEDAFDGIYCWGTTFGYFDEQKNAEVIDKVHRALRRGGRFLLDVVNRDFIVSRVPSMQWFEGDGCVCMDDAQMNAITSRLQVKRTLMMEDGRQRELDYSIRLYSLHELGKLLHEHGFRVAECSGDTSTPGTYFGAESPRIVILAEKR